MYVSVHICVELNMLMQMCVWGTYRLVCMVACERGYRLNRCWSNVEKVLELIRQSLKEIISNDIVAPRHGWSPVD